MRQRIEVPPMVAPARLISPADAAVHDRARIHSFAVALRPKQWVKNTLVFAAPGAAGLLGVTAILARAGLAFVVMCLVASAGYL